MPKNSLIIAIVAVAVLVVIGIIAGIVLTAKGGNENNQGSSGIQAIDNGSQQTGSASSGGASGTSGAEQNITASISPRTPQTYSINIENFAFSPSEIRIKAGDTIVWTNKDSVSHTVTSDSASELSSGFLSRGESYSHKFNTAGTFNYHCAPHPYMKGKIIVE
ncbi:cupredoxin family copper-binding protein [Candidatus Pacearchaeota archaeon]|nr:cupredoxin family copper-binding protein [Candidatus Pacearchaeota archaeon]